MENGTTELLMKWAEYDTLIWTIGNHLPEEFVCRNAERLLKQSRRDPISGGTVDFRA